MTLPLAFYSRKPSKNLALMSHLLDVDWLCVDFNTIPIPIRQILKQFVEISNTSSWNLFIYAFLVFPLIWLYFFANRWFLHSLHFIGNAKLANVHFSFDFIYPHCMFAVCMYAYTSLSSFGIPLHLNHFKMIIKYNN